jgi:hypothetical protein
MRDTDARRSGDIPEHWPRRARSPEETGEPYRPDTLPVIYDPEGDEDSSA